MSPICPLNVTFDEMKPYLCFLSGLSVVLSSGCVGTPSASAQSPVPVVTVSQTTSAPSPLEELVAPIALYPDALIALILPASTVSSDVVLAARYLNSSVDANVVDQQPWDESVKGLAHYPDVLKWMDENLAWTQRMGEAYMTQPDQVMAAVQQARARAREKGLLVDTPQQQVVVESSAIRIIPAQPDVIYVPRYDPQVIYVERPVYMYPEPWISFGIGFGVGAWLSYDCDWRSRTIWVDRHRWDRGRDRDWRHPHFPGRSDYVSHDNGWHQWRPSPGRPRATYRHFDRPGNREFARPAPLPGTPWHHRENDRNVDRSRERDHERRRGRLDRTADESRPFIQPNRVAAPQTPGRVLDQGGIRVDESKREPGATTHRRWQPPSNAGQPGTFSDRRSRPDRRMGPQANPALAPNPSAPVTNDVPSSSSSGSIQRSAPAARPDGEHRRFRMPDRVAAPAGQAAPVARQQPAQAAASSAPVVAQPRSAPQAERADRSDHMQRSGDNREKGRGRRDRQSER